MTGRHRPVFLKSLSDRKLTHYQAVAALDDAFLSATSDHEGLFEVAVTKTWLHQVIVGLTLICRSSYRGVVEFLRDLLGLSISVGTVHQGLQSATRQAGVINHDQDLSRIRVGLHDEIFQGATPVRAGVVPTTRLPPSWRLRGKPRPKRMSWPATSKRSPNG